MKELKPIPGGPYDLFIKARQRRLAKNPEVQLNRFVDAYGMEAVSNMDEVNIGEYIYSKGINFSLNINVGRNIPWLEDGLKSVERRVLYIMHRAGLTGNKSDKLAAIVGDMLKYVHPHGEASAAGTIYRLGRPRTIMLPYVSSSSNFGNMYDMIPASTRYASASLSEYAIDCFFSENGAKYPIYAVKDNYKYSEKEPVYLTSRYPNILMQWNLGIGKGAQSMLGAFSPKDVFKSAIKLLDDPNAKIDIYPDTPTPVNIINKKELKGCFDKAIFKVVMRSPYEVRIDRKRDGQKIVDKHTIVFTSLPVSVMGLTVENEIRKIKEEDEKRKTNKRLPEVLNIEVSVNDNTPGGIEFIVEYEKGYDPNALAEKLLKATSLGKTIGVRYVLIHENKPSLFTPREILLKWIAQRYDHKRSYIQQLAIKCAKDRSKLDAIYTILSVPTNIDKVVKISKESKTEADAIRKLMEVFKFTEFQSTCILQTRLSQLSKMNVNQVKTDRDKARDEYTRYRKLLSDDEAIKAIIKDELMSGMKKYGRDRIAPIVDGVQATDNNKRVILYDENTYYCVPSVDELGLIGDNLSSNLKMVSTSGNTPVIIISKTGQPKLLDTMAFRTTSHGIMMEQLAFSNVVSIIPLTDKMSGVAMITKNGYAKILSREVLEGSSKSRLMRVDDGDHIVSVIAIPVIKDDNDTIAVHTTDSVVLLKLSTFPELGRSAYGTRVIKNNATITGMSYVSKDYRNILIYTAYGFVKVVELYQSETKKKKSVDISTGNKPVIGVIGLQPGKLTCVGAKSYTGMVTIDKSMIQFTFGSTVTTIRLGTSISNPVKVIKTKRNDFYMIK